MGGDKHTACKTLWTKIQNFYKVNNCQSQSRCLLQGDTVDGRNPAPVDVVNIPLFTGFLTSQVVQDSFHQQ